MKDSTGKMIVSEILKLSRLRRVVLLIVLILFFLQFFRIDLLAGSLTGSSVAWFVNLLDVFAFLENLFASKNITIKSLLSVLSIIVFYFLMGRAFCGWICPMDLLFLGMNKVRKKKISLNLHFGYALAGLLLLSSLITGVPLFTNYLSHITNFFRTLTSGLFMALELPVNPSVLFFSISIMGLYLILEFFFPRLWCKTLCPLGRTYGLFNKISLLKIRFSENECQGCKACEEACYMDVKITQSLDKGILRDENCIFCGHCIDACTNKGKLIHVNLFSKNKQ